ncbi:MAG: nucleoside/nucleotide kinase family protein, partial [Enterobacter hormaechei]
MKIGLTVNGLHVEAHYPDDEIENVHKPLLRQLAKLHSASASKRTIVFLSAPPGTGKSTLTAFWD